MSATVLVIGSGGREHAMSWRLSTSPKVSRVIAAPGNPGFNADAELVELWPANLSLGFPEYERLALLAKENKVDLVLIGPDNALADGATDAFEAQGLLCFGPSQQAAQIESSKAFAKDVMKAADVPTARHFVAGSFSEAVKILKSVPWKSASGVLGWVVKADGLALGKGVRVCSSFEEAEAAARDLISISGSLVIEERLQGEELSWFAFCAGDECALLEPARDYKRLKTGNEGPNTGGMGAFSPVPGIPSHWTERVLKEVFLPTLRELKKRGTPFKGLLYAGLMCDVKRDRFWVIEFNARFGDPETQVLLPRMSDDFYEWCLSISRGEVAKHLVRLGRSSRQVGFGPETAVGVVAASPGYPENPQKALKLSPKNDAKGISYFYAGVARVDNSSWVTSGGRVYLALGLSPGFKEARERAYKLISELSFEGMQFRTDIAAETV